MTHDVEKILADLDKREAQRAALRRRKEQRTTSIVWLVVVIVGSVTLVPFLPPLISSTSIIALALVMLLCK